MSTVMSETIIFDRKTREEREYWVNRFSRRIDASGIGTDFPRPARRGTHTGSVEIRIEGETQRKLSALTGESPLLLYTTLMSVLKICLHKYTGSSTVVVGSPIRRREDGKSQPPNVLAIVDEVEDRVSFQQFLLSVRQTLQEGYSKQRYPFQRLLKDLGLENESNRCALFDVVLALDELHSEQSLELNNDLTITFKKEPEGIVGHVNYSSELFESDTIEVFVGHYLNLLRAALADTRASVGCLSLLNEEERHRLLVEWNGTKTDQLKETCVHYLFEAQAEKTPDAIALTIQEEHITYIELNRRANQLAHYLRELGIEEESLVGLCLNRSVELLIGELGILKAGGAYVPLDPTYPRERLSFMLDDAHAPVLLTQKHLLDELPSHRMKVICLDAGERLLNTRPVSNPEGATSEHNLAYVIYTSGSSGRPKGVQVTHRALLNLVGWHRRRFAVEAGDRATQLASVAFDAAVWEVWPYLLSGASLHLPGEERLYEAKPLREWLVDQQITLSFVPTPVAEGLLEEREWKGAALRGLLTGGDRLRRGKASGVGFEVVNNYGPTECAVVATSGEVREREGAERAPGIGRAIDNVGVYVLRGEGEVAGVGIAGEVYIGGEGVARGYLNRAELTAERFVPDGVSREQGGRLYRTGDLARYTANGELEFLGRIDHQVKVRGYRIELGEIEAVLSRHPLVRECVVVIREDEPGDKRLVAYLVTGEEVQASAESSAEWRRHLSRELPDYMLPHSFVTLDSLPLTPNGKVDRKALPAPDMSRANLALAFVPPQTPAQQALSEVWAEVLGLDRVGIRDNFFSLGGDSIRSIQVASKAQQRGLELSLNQLFQYPTIEELCSMLALTQPEPAPVVALAAMSLVSEEDRVRLPAGVVDAYPLSHLQAGMLFHSEYSPESRVYHNVLSYHLRAPFNQTAFAAAVAELVSRHEVLRTSFDLGSYSEPLQLVHAEVASLLIVRDLRHLEAGELERALAEEFAAEGRWAFDWARAPLLRLKVTRRTDETFQLTITFHHAILDGWSDSTLMTELFSRYWQLIGEAAERDLGAPPEAGMRQYVGLERAAVESAQSRAYWEEQLAGVEVTRVRRWGGSSNVGRQQGQEPDQRERRTQALTLAVSAEVIGGVEELAREVGVPLKSVMLAAHLRVLSWVSGREEVVSGYVLNGRPEGPDGERMLGVFLNTLPFRQEVSGGSWEELVRGVYETEAKMLPHRRYPLAQLQKLAGGDELFEAAFNYTHFHVIERLSEYEGKLSALGGEGVGETNFRLLMSFSVDPFNSQLRLILRFDEREYDRAEMVSLLDYYKRTLEQMAGGSQGRYDAQTLLSEGERQQLLVEWNDTQADSERHLCLHELFERQAWQRPDAIALSFEEQQVSYSALQSRSDRLARRLRRLGVGAETVVGLYAERSVELVVGVLSILKAGGAYLPLDTRYPRERLQLMLEDAGIRVLLTQREFAADFAQEGLAIALLENDMSEIMEEREENPIPAATPDNIAYLIYTSGSTGKPKGVPVTHYNVARLFETTRRWFGFDEQDVWTLFHSYAFDFSVWELWGALGYGGRLLIVPYMTSRSPEQFHELLRSEGVTVLNQTPSAFRQLMRADETLNGGAALSLRRVIFGGEVLELQSLRPWLNRHGEQEPQLINMYGITETTVHVTYRRILRTDLEDGKGSVIGTRLPDLQTYILDPNQQPVPLGVPGELCVGGAGLARGYLNRPELTAERFIPNPFGSSRGARLYRSGDLGKYLPDGDIEYLGRMDDQVKIRGFRIELGEIEATLNTHASVAESCVIARPDATGVKRLFAYVVPSNGQAVTTAEMRDHLSERLPEYMLPSGIVNIEALPLTRNGKVDRKMLAAIEVKGEGRRQEYVEASSELERVLVEVWAEVLDVERVGVKDNYFALGGDSIQSIQVVAKAKLRGVSFTIEDLFQNPTIEQLVRVAGRVERVAEQKQGGEAFSLISDADREKLPEDVEDAYPLAKLQAGMIFHSEYMPETSVYHDIMSYHVRGEMHQDAMRDALREVMRRQNILRTSFDLTQYSEPLQLVHREVAAPMEVIDLQEMSEVEQEKELEGELARERARAFEWSQAPLMRVKVYLRSEDRYQLMLSFHHAILDGWSLAALMTELYQSYMARLGKGRAEPSEELKVSYRDYVELEQEALNSEACQRFWEDKLADQSVLRLPRWPQSERPAPSIRRVGRKQISLSSQVLDGLNRLAVSIEAPLKSVMLAAHLRVLSLLSGQQDVTTGMVWHGRLEGSGGERVLGLFLNTVPFRLRLLGGTWRELAQETFETEREMVPYRRFPMSEMQRMAGGQALFETTFDFLHFHIYQKLSGLKNELALLGKAEVTETNFTLGVHFARDPFSDGLLMVLDYDDRELSAQQVEAMKWYYTEALAVMADDPASRWEYHSLLSAGERQQLLKEWNNTEVERPELQYLHGMFEQQVERTPDAVALVFEDQRLTYAGLNRCANRWAWKLRSLGVGPDSLVGICVDRSSEMVIGLLSILKAGGAYVPLDPDYPVERLAYMLANARIDVLLTEERHVEKFNGDLSHVLCLDKEQVKAPQTSDANPPTAISGGNLAYVIYTSGSTGDPKGAMNTHSGIFNRLLWMQETYRLTPHDRVLQKTPYTFDVSVWEFFWPLAVGAPLVLASPGGHRDPSYLNDLIIEQGITTLHFVPSMLQSFLQEMKWLAGATLRRVICSGETLPAELKERFFARASCELHNLYGPTEAAVDVTYWECKKESAASSVPIGRPISKTEIYLLDSWHQPVPVCVPGELYIGGAGLARGYLNRPELTAERFAPDPLSRDGGARLYRTGDLARYAADGEIEFIGRTDHQVKVRGFRIELGEIETVLSRHPAVRECVVVAREDVPGDKRLVAYVVTEEDREVTSAEWRRHLIRQVPDYMLPSSFVVLAALPLTPNGKVDRKALPAPDGAAGEERDGYVGPRTPVEELIAGLWSEVLGVQRVGIHDNFFELGGHSLLATQLISRLRRALGVEVPLRTLFESPTVAGLSAGVEEAQREQQGLQAPPLVAVARNSLLPLPLSFAQQRLWFLDQLETNSPFYNVPTAVRLTGELNLTTLEQTFAEIVRRHEVLRTSFPAIEGEPVQAIAPAGSLFLPLVDLSGLPQSELGTVARKLAFEEGQRPFNLSQGPLLRLSLLLCGPAEQVVLLTMHHIITDGWSTSILTAEVNTLYDAFASGVISPLAELPVQYADFACWQRQWLQGEVLEAQLTYWKRQLGDNLPVLQLPMDRPRPEVPNWDGEVQTSALSADLLKRLQELSRREGVTLFMTLLAAFKTLLHRYTSQIDIAVGTDIANRNRAETEGLIGLFVNILILRTDLSHNPSFRELLSRVREMTLGAYAHQDMPFDKLVEELGPERSASATPLFQVLFILQNTPRQSPDLSGLNPQPLGIGNPPSRFDLTVSLTETADGLFTSWRYSTALFEAETVKRMLTHFETLLESIVAQPDARLDAFEMLTEEEKKQQARAERAREEANFKKFKNIKPRPITLPQGELIKSELLRPDQSLPLLIQPAVPNVDLISWAASSRGEIERKLTQHGAILFRNFEILNMSEFEDFAMAICPRLFSQYGDLPRENVGRNIYSSTPYPAEQSILFHNESSHMHQWPGKIWFYCVQAAEEGGETPIVDCRRVYQLLDPKIKKRFEEKKLLYVRNFVEGLDVSWQEIFQTTERAAVEEYCRRAAIEFEWRGESQLTIRRVCEAVLEHPLTGEKVFFNQVQLHHPSCLDRAVESSLLALLGSEAELPRNVYYGDGSHIESSVVSEIRQIYEEVAVSFPWQEGDVLMLDNILTAHGRNPYVGQRKIVVSMGDLISHERIMSQDSGRS